MALTATFATYAIKRKSKGGRRQPDKRSKRRRKRIILILILRVDRSESLPDLADRYLDRGLGRVGVTM
jgi:hypothetical protein